jgi:hypothetical protein
MRVTDWSQWGRAIDYLFGRNALIGLASLMLLIISGYATWAGMNDFIVGAASAAKGRDVPGGFNVSHTNLVIAVTVALTFLMWIALRESIGRERPWHHRAITAPLYLFLVLWSVGFGYGFWWSLIAGEEATRTGLSALQEDARDAGNAVSARLDAVKTQLESVVTWSDSQMAREESSGGSCGVASGAGRGPLYNSRRAVRDGVASLRDNVNKIWIGPAQADLEILRQAAQGLDGGSAEDRQKQFETKAATIRGTAKNIATRSNELGQSTATEMRALAESVSKQGQAGTCYDPTLATRLRQAADQAAVPAKLQLRNVVFNEGPAGVANAVKNLWTNLGSYFTSLVSYVFSGGKSTGTHTNAGEPITGRDMIALLATIGIDIGLFVLALLDRPGPPPVQRDGLVANQARLHSVPANVRRELEAAFRTAVARAKDVDMEWVRRHFVHHNGASFFVIPNLYSVEKGNDSASTAISKKEELWALALNQLAGVMEDVKLVKAVTPKELKVFIKEESRSSLSDLSVARKKWQADNKTAADPSIDVTPIRNHGLLSKAERALDIAGWSAKSKRDIEVFKLVDIDGLTPLLSLLNDATLDQPLPTPVAAYATPVTLAPGAA